MKEFIEKLIGRLEEYQKVSTVKGIYGEYRAYSNAIGIVNQLAEEYNNESVNGDLISRQTVLEVLEKSFNNYSVPWCKNAFSTKIKNEIISIPTTYNAGWIPCSEKLPPKPENNMLFENKPLELYLATVKDSDYAWRVFWNGGYFTDGWNKVDVIAWQELPKVYKSKEGES